MTRLAGLLSSTMLICLLAVAILSCYSVRYLTPRYTIGTRAGAIEVQVGGVAYQNEAEWRTFCFDWPSCWVPCCHVFTGMEVPSGWIVRLPLWIPMVMVAPLALCYYVIPIIRTRRRRRRGYCLVCGYDLTGNQSGRCPECGHTKDLPKALDRDRFLLFVPWFAFGCFVLAVLLLRLLSYTDGPNSPVKRAERLCANEPWARLSVRYWIDEARCLDLSREELIVRWEPKWIDPDTVNDACLDAIVDAGFDIAVRWDGKQKE